MRKMKDTLLTTSSSSCQSHRDSQTQGRRESKPKAETQTCTFLFETTPSESETERALLLRKLHPFHREPPFTTGTFRFFFATYLKQMACQSLLSARRYCSSSILCLHAAQTGKLPPAGTTATQRVKEELQSRGADTRGGLRPTSRVAICSAGMGWGDLSPCRLHPSTSGL